MTEYGKFFPRGAMIGRGLSHLGRLTVASSSFGRLKAEKACLQLSFANHKMLP